VPVGAAVYAAGRRIATAGNTTRASLDPTRHAEAEALRRAARRLGRWRLNDAVLYSTVEPCVLCAAACVLFRVGRVVYGCPEPKFGGVESRLSVFKAGLNHRPEVRGGVLAPEAAALMRGFFRQRRRARPGSRPASG
jgi:tRNA(adenine34) deaminase